MTEEINKKEVMFPEENPIKLDTEISEYKDIDTGGVKSIAVVKKCIPAANVPPRFLQLSCNTNLNDPPSNWLRMRAIQRDHQHKLNTNRESRHHEGVEEEEEERESTSPWIFPKQNSTLFSSFVIANNFPDYVGEVDVVSDAENIKKLLKIPFCNSHISMMVHRVGKTILLDEFDIHSHLLRASKKEWQWLKKFYYDHLTELQETEKKCLRKNKSRGYLQYKNMLSKFLYHSVVNEGYDNDTKTDSEKDTNFSQPETGFHESDAASASCGSPIRMPSLASITFQGGSTVEQLVPRSAEEIDPGNEHHEFLRNVLWTFEDIRMLIGSDLPIFGGGTHPVVSLRLRDMAKPINVLTGLDYWLDNLMCNVPEVVMCYHLDGIVKKYELLKTEDIPKMSSESQFSPKLVKDIAQNLLSFLKSNATKSGHTYWLLKGKHDDVVKLYDLTTLLDKEEVVVDDERERESETTDDGLKRNPFTLPVAMLLYRVAINMKESKQGKRGTVFKLLSNCLMLIDKKTHPQVAASAHYLLADLYFPNDMEPNIVHQSLNIPASEESDDTWQSSSDESDDRDDKASKKESKFSVDVKSLCRIPVPCHGKEGLSDAEKAIPSFGQNWQDRCLKGQREILEGLKCIALKYQTLSKTTTSVDPTKLPSESTNKTGTDSGKNEEWVEFARPSQSIPLPFTPLKNKDKDKTKDEKAIAMSPKQNLAKNYCKAVLFLKNVQIYSALGEVACTNKEYGRALQCVQLGLVSDANAARNMPVKQINITHNFYISHLLGLAGDVHFISVRKEGSKGSFLDETVLKTHKDEFEEYSILDSSLKEHFSDELEIEYDWCYQWPKTTEEALKLSVRCYKTAINLFEKQAAESVGPRKEAYMSLTRRLAYVCNELGIYYMNEGLIIWNDIGVLNDNVATLWKNSEEQLSRSLKAFEETKDVNNSALLNSNLGRLMRVCASACHTLPNTTSNQKPLTNQEKRYYQKAIQYYKRAMEILKEKQSDNTQQLENVHWDLCTTLFTKATQMQDYPPLANISQEEVENEIVSSMQKALELCDIGCQKGPQYLYQYQYRAATIHHRLGSLHHNAFRNTISNDHRRKLQKQKAESHYDEAAKLYEIVGSSTELVSVLLKWIALREASLASQTGAKSKLRTLYQMLEVAVKCKCIFQQGLAKEKGATKSESIACGEDDEEQQLDSLLNLMCQKLISLIYDICKYQKSGKAAEKKWNKIISILEKKDNNVIKNISCALDDIEKNMIHYPVL